MFSTLLVPTDGSSLSNVSIRAAARFAARYGGKIVALSVAEPRHFSSGETSADADAELYEKLEEQRARERVSRVEEIARAAGVECETVVVRFYSPSGAIIDTAKKFGCDVIFMASGERTRLSKMFIGSETHDVLEDSPVPVLVFPPGAEVP